MSVCSSVCWFVGLLVCLSVSLSLRPSVRLPACLSTVCLPISMSICFSVCLSGSRSVDCLSASISIGQPGCLWACLSIFRLSACISMFVCLPACLKPDPLTVDCLSVNRYVYLFVCPSTYLSTCRMFICMSVPLFWLCVCLLCLSVCPLVSLFSSLSN